MRLRRTLALGVLALSGLADRAFGQYPPPAGYYPRPQQVAVPTYPNFQPSFQAQPGLPRPPQPVMVPGQVAPPNPYLVNSTPPTMARPLPPMPVNAPPPNFKIDSSSSAWRQSESIAPPKAQADDEPPAEEFTPPPLPAELSAPPPGLRQRQRRAEANFDVDCDPITGLPYGHDVHEEREKLNRFWIQGGYIFLQPRWNNNPSFATGTQTLPAGILTATGQRDFAFDWTLTPRVEIGGAFDGGFGVRARWMYFDQTAADTLTRPAATALIVGAAPLGLQDGPDAGETASTNARLYFQVIDFEGIQEWRWQKFSTYVSGGLRYAYLQQNYDYFETNLAGGSDTMSYSSFFNGLGPTVSAEGRRRFEDWGLSVFAITRASLLFGRYTKSASDNVVGFPGRTATKDEEDVLPITELEFGFEWGRRLSSGARLFITLGGFGQLWMRPGNSSDSSPVFTQDPLGPGARLPLVDPNSGSRSDLGLIGLSLTAGLQF